MGEGDRAHPQRGRLTTTSGTVWPMTAPRARSSFPMLVVALVILAGCTTDAPDSAPTSAPAPSPTAPAATVRVAGGIGIGADLALPIPADDGSQCRGSSDYARVQAGDQVEIHDAAGTVVALTQLEPAKLSEAGACAWTFAAEAPAGGAFYRAVYDRWESQLVAEEALGSEALILK